jgi:hypothetical protein
LQYLGDAAPHRGQLQLTQRGIEIGGRRVLDLHSLVGWSIGDLRVKEAFDNPDPPTFRGGLPQPHRRGKPSHHHPDCGVNTHRNRPGKWEHVTAAANPHPTIPAPFIKTRANGVHRIEPSWETDSIQPGRVDRAR